MFLRSSARDESGAAPKVYVIVIGFEESCYERVLCMGMKSPEREKAQDLMGYSRKGEYTSFYEFYPCVYLPQGLTTGTKWEEEL